MMVAALGTIALLALAGLVYQQLGLRRDAKKLAAPGALIDIGGHRVHVICSGSGAPLVLLESGVAASSLSWAKVHPQIARFTRVCAYDRPGLGWSDPPSAPVTFDRIVDELEDLLRRLGPEQQCVLVGHSFGSFIVRAFARRHPTAVCGIVLVDPAVEWLTPTLERERMLWGARYLSRVGSLLARFGVVRACLALLTGGAPGAPRNFVKVFGPTAARTLERLVGEVRKLPPEVHPLVQALWCQPKCFSAMADHLAALERARPAIEQESSPPEIPVVVISSGDQPDDQLAAQRALAEASNQGRHIVAARSTHWIQFDQPELIVQAVLDIISNQ